MEQRADVIAKITADPQFDILVVGGGASGIGIALDAALRGFRTLLVEKHDFTKGTSSKSTKLVHGGVRYLAQGDVKLVREALKERGMILKNAPHITHNQPFIIPSYGPGTGLFYTIGLTLYDLLSGKYSLGRSRFFGATKVREKLRGVKTDGLRGGVKYHDGQFDDSRLALDILHKLFAEGGLAINYMELTALEKDAAGRVTGALIQDVKGGKQFQVAAKSVINATGIWSDRVMRMDDADHLDSIMPSQGIHLVLSREFLPGKHALMIPKTSDGRVLFAVPWHDKLVVGTTDTPVDTEEAEPLPLQQEIDFILQTATAYFEKPVTPNDVLSVFVGLRPLAAPQQPKKSKATNSEANPSTPKTKEISRSHKIIVSDSGLISVIGGKWTTYRKIAEDAVDAAIKDAALKAAPCKTMEYRLSTAAVNQDHLALYGDHAAEIRNLIAKDPDLGKQVHESLPYTWAEMSWIAKHEMVESLEDILARRTRILLLDARVAVEIAPAVARHIAAAVGWKESRIKQEVTAFGDLAQRYLINDTL